ncbi:MAG: hypothetical protein NC541_04000 [bacterium]|nr:hypothetical protein [bacterium]
MKNFHLTELFSRRGKITLSEAAKYGCICHKAARNPAESPRDKKYRQKRGIPAARICLILVLCALTLPGCAGPGVGKSNYSPDSSENSSVPSDNVKNSAASDYSADGSWRTGDSTLLPSHREDFTQELSAEEQAAFEGMPEVMKIYRTLYNDWYLAEDLTDFSQALTADPYYILHGYVCYQSDGSDGEAREGAYGVYTLDESGQPRWGMGTSGPATSSLPYELCGLTRKVIEEDLAGIDCEDYIVAQSTLLYTVFVWARCPGGEDKFVTYPATPAFVGLENRRVYTLNEILQILKETPF